MSGHCSLYDMQSGVKGVDMKGNSLTHVQVDGDRHRAKSKLTWMDNKMKHHFCYTNRYTNKGTKV